MVKKLRSRRTSPRNARSHGGRARSRRFLDSADYSVSLDVVHLLRVDPKRSLRKTSRELGTSYSTVLRHVGPALQKRRGRYFAKSSDRLRRELIFYSTRGQFALTTHSSRQATTIAKYHNAVRAYVIFGDDSALKEFEGENITVRSKVYPFITDRRTLNRLARAGELHFLDIYADGGGK